MRRRLLCALFILISLCFAGCNNTNNQQVEVENSAEGEVNLSMKLYIDGEEIPVIWEENDSVTEIMEEVTKLLANGDVILELAK